MRVERAIIRRRDDRPGQAEGERVQFELDPERMARMFDAGERFLGQLNRLLGTPSRRRRRGRK
jgi:hypothetical protein